MRRPRAPWQHALAMTLFAAALAAGAAAVVGLAEQAGVRIDLTARGEHRLSDRTRAVLRGLSGGTHEIVAAIDLAARPREVTDRAIDVLETLASETDLISASVIDLGSPGAAGEIERLLERLGAREAAEATRQAAIVDAGLAEAGAIADALDDLAAAAVARGAEASPAERGVLARVAAIARSNAERLRERPAAGGTAATALGIASAAERAAEELTQASAEARAAAGSLAGQLGLLRERASLLAGRLGSIEPTDAERVAAELESGEALLLIGPRREGRPSVIGLSLSEILVPPALLEAAGLSPGAEAARTTEELAAAGLAAMSGPPPPRVVFTHAQAAEGLTRVPQLAGLVRRLRDRGWGVDEWHVPTTSEPPTVGDGPRVLVAVAPETTAPAGTLPDGRRIASGADRAAALARALERELSAGSPLLLSLAPSVLPSIGEPDPLAELLVAFGLRGDVARPVLRTELAARGVPIAAVDHEILPAGGAHPLAGAIRGLPATLPWPLPIEMLEAEGTQMAALLRIDAGDGVWSETRWRLFRQASAAQRALLPEQPTYDPGQGDGRGPWVVAAAAEREGGRVVLVGSNGWFVDEAWRASQGVDGRAVLTHPGNIELFESAVLWLAGQEELLGGGASTRAVPRIRALSPGGLEALRLSLIFGPGVLILVFGLTLRIVRR